MKRSLRSCHAKLVELTDSIQRLREAFLDREPLLPGSVYTLRRRCGKPNCRCAEGHLHETEILSYRGGEQPKNITPRPGELEAFKQWTEAYQRFRQARAQMVKLHRQIMELVDHIEVERVRQGTRKFQALRAETSKSNPKR